LADSARFHECIIQCELNNWSAREMTVVSSDREKKSLNTFITLITFNVT